MQQAKSMEQPAEWATRRCTVRKRKICKAYCNIADRSILLSKHKNH